MKLAAMLRNALFVISLAALGVGWMGYARYEGSRVIEVSDQRQLNDPFATSLMPAVPRVTIGWDSSMTVQKAVDLSHFSVVDLPTCTISVSRWSRWNWARVDDRFVGFIYRVPYLRNVLEDWLKGRARESSADYIEIPQENIWTVKTEPGDYITLITK
jgi:hypothetical protein